MDHHVGRRLRARRRQLGWSEADLAHRIGTTRHTLSRCERGLSSLGPAQLFRAARALAVNIDHFFDGLPGAAAGRAGGGGGAGEERGAAAPNRDEVEQLVGLFLAIGDAEACRTLLRTVQAIAGSPAYGDVSKAGATAKEITGACRPRRLPKRRQCG
jgi:transcriptional regulator with XRE-family HTH domain